MVGWHHQLNKDLSELAPGDGVGQRGSFPVHTTLNMGSHPLCWLGHGGLSGDALPLTLQVASP